MSDESLKAPESTEDEASTPIEAPAAADEATPAAADEATPAEATEAAEAPAEDALVAAQREAADWKARAYRAAADIENIKKRHIKDRAELRKYGAQNVMRELLPVYDNLERAVEHAPDPDDPLAQGVRMVMRQLSDAMKSAGARTFEAKGELFDPQIHEAMSQMPTEAVPPGHVAQVFQRGWYLHDRMIRPAMVVVATELPEAEPEAGADDLAGDTQPYQAVFAEAVEAVEAAKSEPEAGAAEPSADPDVTTQGTGEA